MKSGRWILRALAWSIFASAALSCSSSQGELLLKIDTNLGIPKDIKSISIDIYGKEKERLLHLGPYSYGAQSKPLLIPATFAITSDSGSVTPIVRVKVIALTAQQEPRIVREIMSTIPKDRSVVLPISLGWLCTDDSLKFEDQNGYSGEDREVNRGRCPEGTCVAGECISVEENKIDPGTLEDTDKAKIFGEPESGGSGCLDVDRCFGEGIDVTDLLETDSCFVPLQKQKVKDKISKGQFNVGVRTESTGICGASGTCLVPLSYSDKQQLTITDGDVFFETNDGVKLPSSLCARIKSYKEAQSGKTKNKEDSAQLLGVTIAPTSNVCRRKTSNLPTCGPWSWLDNVPSLDPGAPKTLAANQDHPVALAVDEGKVYWTNAGQFGGKTGMIKYVPRKGGDIGVLAQGLANPHDLAVVRSAKNGNLIVKLFWADSGSTTLDGEIRTLDIPWDKTQVPPTIAPGLNTPEGVYTDPLGNGPLFFTVFGEHAIYRSDYNGSSKVKIASTADTFKPNYPYRIVGDGRAVYWTNEGVSNQGNGSVAMIDLEGKASVAIATRQEAPRGIAVGVDADKHPVVYWVSFAKSGSIWMSTIAGGVPSKPKPLTTKPQDYPSGIALDETFVYWTNRGDGKVMKMARSGGGEPEIVASGQRSPGAIVVYKKDLYWINEGTSTSADGAVMFLESPSKE